MTNIKNILRLVVDIAVCGVVGVVAVMVANAFFTGFSFEKSLIFTKIFLLSPFSRSKIEACFALFSLSLCMGGVSQIKNVVVRIVISCGFFIMFAFWGAYGLSVTQLA